MKTDRKKNTAFRNSEIAVIGIAARFPGAGNHEEFWKNLEAGKSSVSEVPENRWDWKAYWGDPKTQKNKSNSKWGGFIDHAECFDADFFGMSAKEVELMDPQQRIMLELAWSCFEDAGIPPSNLSAKKVGVFLGVFNFDYKELQERSGHFSIEAHHSTGTASAIIANRISYYFNLRGPSVPIDTACSSSLNAIHNAVQSLNTGDCALALAGGINLLLTPTRHISFSKTGMLSPTGSCKTFDDRADGYVRGEGAGLLLLKPLEQALQDKNHIWGIIKGTAVNHGGKTYSLTYPNPEAQTEVIVAAQKAARITSETIGYIEAHGTGTPKGDPMEFKGLLDAFSSTRASAKKGKAHYCGLGSVKTNIGHLEAAAGVAGVIKVLLSMRHQRLPGLQNFAIPNHRMSLEGSPFFLVTELTDWKALRGARSNALPRRAGVSSFGFGGTNAHVVLEEAPEFKSTKNVRTGMPYYIALLSCKTPEGLVEKQKDLLQWLEANESQVRITDVCKTLAAGREHFQERIAIVVENVSSLTEKLKRSIAGEESSGCFRSDALKKLPGTEHSTLPDAQNSITHTLETGNPGRQQIHENLKVLAALYAGGHGLSFDKPWLGEHGRIISLPTYPFVRKRYWIPADPDWGDGAPNAVVRQRLHTLLNENISDFRHHRFKTTFSGEEFFISDHVIRNKKILPAVVYLEMVRAAAAELSRNAPEGQTFLLKNVSWEQPMIIGPGGIETKLAFRAQGENAFSFEIFSDAEANTNERLIYSQGLVEIAGEAQSQAFQPGNFKTEAGQKILKEECYRLLLNLGFEYGAAHQALEAVYLNDEKVLAKLKVPQIVAGTLDNFVLHPAITDAALQAALIANLNDSAVKGRQETYLPFALDLLEITGPCTPEMWATAAPVIGPSSWNRSIRKFDINVFDSDGRPCVHLRGLTFKLREAEKRVRDDESPDVLFLTPEWKEKQVSASSVAFFYPIHSILLYEDAHVDKAELQGQFPEARIKTLPVISGSIGKRYLSYAEAIFSEAQSLMKGGDHGKKLLQIVVPATAGNVFAGVRGLLATARRENPNITAQIIAIHSAQQIPSILRENAGSPDDHCIKYVDGKRYVSGWSEPKISIANTAPVWKDKGVYFITGGVGGLGFLFAKELAEKARNASIVLSGRSPANDAIRARVESLRSLGANVLYKPLDVTDEYAVIETIQTIERDFKRLDGIIHSAGILRDDFMIRKSSNDFVTVLSPKVSGTVHLDEASKHIPLDFFILFSSVVAPLGNVGQADYAAANGFMDEYAAYRSRLVKEKKRSGRTVSVNWPLWKEGGMRLTNEMERAFVENFRMNVLETPAGVASLYTILTSEFHQVMVAPGDPERIRGHLTRHPNMQNPASAMANGEPMSKPGETQPEKVDDEISQADAILYFKELLSATIKRAVDRIDEDAAMEQYGIDSIMVMQMTNRMEKEFGVLPKTLFFEFQNISSLTQYFVKNHSERLRKILASEKVPVANKAEGVSQYPTRELSAEHKVLFQDPAGTAKETGAENMHVPAKALDVAIVGVSGRYPQADNLQEFWDNLTSGKDCITEIPEDRWDYHQFFDADKEREGKSYSKWGGFIKDVDKFDPLFFNITPIEAERMDPQERLFLQCVYETLEDAGYTRQSLAGKSTAGLDNNVGVYVGVMYEEYQLYGAQETANGNPVALWGLPSSIANRVSYFCNFHGPSMAVDTMCSSSLTAIHLACESIARGKCEAAIAGGVNVSVHPNKYLFLSQGRFASSKGRCESFGIGGDGYVPGEGVGAVLLKPLHRAIADGDHIYGVIKSTAVNHGGKTNGYTIPNPVAQASVIQNALAEAGIDPRTISYVEAHGTGTSLGDPIEILGLSKAFGQYTDDKQFCAIGSAKSNIGHCESAAGIAGVTKVLLQMKYRKIVPSLHSRVLNENIDFKDSPFIVQQTLSEWKRPAIVKNGKVTEHALCAGISSFGAGGANAHMIIEEYLPGLSHPGKQPAADADSGSEPVAILLSAMDPERLQQKVKQLLAIRDSNHFWNLTDENLAEMAYTLKAGREHLPVRLALLVRSWNDMISKLQDYLHGIKNISDVFYGEAHPGSAKGAGHGAGLLNDWINHKNYARVLKEWAAGQRIDWNAIKPGWDKSQRRISLPPYPFRRDRYWISQAKIAAENRGNASLSPAKLHPLVHQNISDLTGQRYSVTFTGNEFYLKDHIINGRKVLPAAAFIEMIREAVWQATKKLKYNSTDITLRDIHWRQPCMIGDGQLTLTIELYPDQDAEIRFEVFSRPQDDDTQHREVFCDGSASVVSVAGRGAGDLSLIGRLKQNCNLAAVPKEQCYRAFRDAGFEYGPSLSLLEQVFIGTESIFASASVAGHAFEQDLFFLHPGLLDSALQATLFWNRAGFDAVQMFLPYSIREVSIYRAVPASVCISITKADGADQASENERVLDIRILTENGETCVVLKAVTLMRAVSKAISATNGKLPASRMLLFPSWQQKAAERTEITPAFGRKLIVFYGLGELNERLADAFPETEILFSEQEEAGAFMAESTKVFEKVQHLIKEKDNSNILVQIVLPAAEGWQLLTALSGMFKTAHKENPKFFGQVIQLPEKDNTAERVRNIIRENESCPFDEEIRYTDAGVREVRCWQVSDDHHRDTRLWRDHGIYLITGGAGGLGLLMANEIASQTTGCTLVLTGRSALNESIRTKLQPFSQTSARVIYRQLNVADALQVNTLIQSVHHDFGKLHGIIHCAGVIHDSFIINKTPVEWEEVLAPKVQGVTLLDHATRNDVLDFFIFFSSITGAVGNVGQADYATANAFMDQYAGFRNTLVAKGSRTGRTLSVNWPLWREGGMQVDRNTEDFLFESMGITPLSTQFAMEGLNRAMRLAHAQVMILEGDAEQVRNKIISPRHTPEVSDPSSAHALSAHEVLIPSAINYFKSLLSSEVKLPFDKIKPEVPLEDYGIDSVMVMKMTGKLEKVFGALSKTLFFEYQSIRELAAYFSQHHGAKLAAVLGMDIGAGKHATQNDPEKKMLNNAFAQARLSSTPASLPFRSFASQGFGIKKDGHPLDIAIVGISGRYPQANDVQEFWKNLVEGKNSITEIPADRWNYKLYFDPDKDKPGKTYSKWGGFLSGVDEFDPRFFNISPREAELMDPQERLFLQCAHETLEDAGYNRDSLGSATGMAGSVGVYVGVMYEEYQLYGVHEMMEGRNIALSGNPASIANRVSYFYNFNGPSMVIDTMCSSSLTAVHLACQSLTAGECKAAIAGGVNISIHPNKYLLLSQGKFISSSGQCESFGIGGDGYVPGEGVGAILLKPLSQAVADGDHIYGVIKGTAINHGGKTNGYTVPNPNAQATAIKQAYQRSGIHPRTVSYVEAHGTGTALGDPIEITGLKKAYQDFTGDHGFCAIGSVKSNIGHGESAAGMAALTKVLLQMKHKTLVPSLHSRELNPNIDFAHSPFVVQQHVAEWKRPFVQVGGRSAEYPRRAGISSFGAGGSNAHVIIEEYSSDTRLTPNLHGGEPAMVVLSARDNQRLVELVQKLQKSLLSGAFQDSDLQNIAYTLQTGRNALDVRLAMIVRSVQELSQKLSSFLEGEEYTDGMYHSSIDRDNGALDAFSSDEDLQAVIARWFQQHKYGKLCELWVKGLHINWIELRKQQGQSVPLLRISLPTYPFARERYWAPKSDRILGDTPLQSGANGTGSPANQNGHQVWKNKEPYHVLTYEERWEERPLPTDAKQRQSFKRLVCFLSDNGEQKKLLEQLRRMNPAVEVTFVGRKKTSASEPSGSAGFYVDSSDPASFHALMQDLLQQSAHIDAFVYLWSFEGPDHASDFSPIIYLLQAIGTKKLKGSRVLLAGTRDTNKPSEIGLQSCYQESWIGFTRSIGLALPDTHVSVVYHDQQAGEVDIATTWARLIWDNLHLSSDREVLYAKGKRMTCKIQKSRLQPGKSLIKSGGTYLITGGLGGIGLLIAEYLVTRYGANLILTGRSPVNGPRRNILQNLNASGSKVQYLQADVADAQAMREGLGKLTRELGPVNGVIHAAGIEEEGTLLQRNLQTFQSVISPKVYGTIALDDVLKDQPLDFMCYFSSAAAILGDFGSCDYAVGNRFQMAYATYRTALCEKGLRKGKTIAINWPLWKNGGMNLKDEDSTRMYLESSGQRALETGEGMELLEQLLAQSSTHHLVLVGNERKVSEFLSLVKVDLDAEKPVQSHEMVKPKQKQSKDLPLAESVEADIGDLVSSILKIPAAQLSTKENFADLGFDSVTLTTFAASLSKHFGVAVVPAVFFSYSTIEKLANHLLKEHHDVISDNYAGTSGKAATADHDHGAVESSASETDNSRPVESLAYEPIAIIGMSGRFPDARNVDEMWRILAEGRNAVKEIPEERFDWRKYYGGEKIQEGKTNCKWTGFIPGMKEFDPLFFEISPSEAKAMDPRQRLLLQEGWKALEDAGYGKSHLEKSKIGLFVGVEEGYYAGMVKQEGSITSNHNAILAARLSYFLNLSGPNMAINTACSSGLVAAHQAFLSLQNGECDTAIAAGVNLMISPEPYITMSQAAMLSADGTCHAFDKKANGIVPGEAVAVIVMKRLSQALADGDPIHATIRGSGINYDGKTNGITAPSGLSQTDLLKSIFEKYSIDPASIDYIVTHGTGTRLGDPVEINALYDAFKGYAGRQNYCALTSAKTNFGHTFAASGLLNLISLVQAFRNEMIPPSLNCDTENDYINWKQSPFFINKTPRPWPSVAGKPRMGAVSAFGMSGTNAHMVLQSFDPPARQNHGNEYPHYLLPLSSHTPQALNEKIMDMISVFESPECEAYEMENMCYTLMQGRHHFKYRCAFIVSDRSDAIAQLKSALLQKNTELLQAEVPGGFKPDRETVKRLAIQLNELPSHIHNAAQFHLHLKVIAGHYCEGYQVDWEKILYKRRPQRLHLPTYPFSRHHYWITGSNDGQQGAHHLPGVKYRQLIEEWEQDQLRGKQVTITELQKFISARDIGDMAPDLVERVYDLCFAVEKNTATNGSADTPGDANPFRHVIKTNGSNAGKDITETIRDLVMQVLELESLDNGQSFQEYGLDSIRAMKLSTRLEKILHIEVPPKYFVEFPTVTELSHYLNSEHHSLSDLN